MKEYLIEIQDQDYICPFNKECKLVIDKNHNCVHAVLHKHSRGCDEPCIVFAADFLDGSPSKCTKAFDFEDFIAQEEMAL